MGANKARIKGLQIRRLKKRAHLQTDTVAPHEIHIVGDHLENFTNAYG
ncbi:hypothetical protein BDK88_2105 [Natrinema hispanicum]|uniref:Uncharacterized protein n=1 Tax=Natrinema hispanicum TaxID=392421 RepID=A0A482YDN3_9EURY|nr:hypothetical protein BDK88_2105 [Natrinema hispanicum]